MLKEIRLWNHCLACEFFTPVNYETKTYASDVIGDILVPLEVHTCTHADVCRHVEDDGLLGGYKE